MDRPPWHCLAGGRDVLRVYRKCLYHGTPGLRAPNTCSVTRKWGENGQYYSWMLAKAASDKTVGKPPTLRGRMRIILWTRGLRQKFWEFTGSELRQTTLGIHGTKDNTL
jgi:anion-transporting  ArsA/GET3 family ATPase